MPRNANHLSTPEGTGCIELSLELLIARRLGKDIARLARYFKPDVLHALRIPFEGIAATSIAADLPTAISVWGQDLAKQAPAAALLAAETRRSLANLRGLHADCHRDIALARQWGAPLEAIDLVAAGNMGYDSDLFCARQSVYEQRDRIFCPRGAGSSINYAGFLRVADRITRKNRNVEFVAARLAGNKEAENIRSQAQHPDRIILTGNLSRAKLAEMYRRSLVLVSPSLNDGTPNSVLEGMGCGAVPIVGDIAPLRELVEVRLPDSLVDPLDEIQMERRIVSVLEAPKQLWTKLSEIAQEIARTGWSQNATFGRVGEWYQRLA
ncbi:MAG: glycosyltransferase family 4 protein [Micromonosporaceae bacterium]|nr:glycosyltransferase family 4 protein [Micromonosporaceae bacterium]